MKRLIKKLLFTLMILVASQMMMAQSFLQEWTKYEKYCSELVPDTIIIAGTVVQKAIPLNNEAGELISYIMVSCGDTTWDKYECNEFKNDNKLIINGVYWNGNWGSLISKLNCNNVEKQVICMIKREFPYFDGFIIWLKLK